MRKIKIFNGAKVENVERQVSEWLVEHRAIVSVTVLQSESYAPNLAWSLTITIFYYEGEQGDA